MEKPKNHEKMCKEVIKLCSDLTFPAKATVLSHLYKRTKLLNECSSEYLKDLSCPSIFKTIRLFLSAKEKDSRTTALKVFRYLCSCPQSFDTLQQSHIDHFLVRAFELEGRGEERMEACKLIRKWLEVAPETFPKSLCSSLVSLGDCEQDDLKEFSIEALRYLTSQNLELVAWSGGLRVLILSALDLKCTQHLSENIVLTINFLINEAESRAFLKNGKEIGRIFSVFTDYEAGLKENELEAAIKLARKFLVGMVKAWPGLIYLVSCGFEQVVNMLGFPVKPIIKEGILETLMEMVCVPVDSSVKYFNILNNYLALLVKGLLHCGLYNALSHCALDKNTRIAHRARNLLKVVTKVASDLLPESPQVSLNLISGNEGKTAELVAEIANSARITNILSDSNMLKLSCDFISSDSGSSTTSSVILVNLLKQHILNSLDDTQYLNLINRSQVSKEVAKWEWPIIHEIISGPISTPLRFIHPQSQKFLKNLVGYFMPSKGLFSSLPWHPCNFIKSRVGWLLITLLLSQEEGISLLSTTYSESFFVVRKSYMGELSDALEEEVKFEESQNNSNSRVFPSEKVKKCMAREYFRWIGIFLSSRSGKKLLKTYNIDSKIMKLATVEHLAPVLLTVLDFKEENSQQFLNLMLQSKSKLLRLKAIECLRGIYRSGSFNLSWAIWGLKSLLHSTDVDSVTSSICLLDELCQFKENLLTLIDTGPQILLKLGELGNQVLIRFLSSSKGVQYLAQMDYIQDELERWNGFANQEYTQIIEEKVQHGLTAPKKMFALVVHVPKPFQLSDRLQLNWISKLPLNMIVNWHGGKVEVDCLVELDKEDAYLTSYFDHFDITNFEGLSASLLLGQSSIDSKGSETREALPVKCPREASSSPKSDSHHFESSGVIFSLSSGRLLKISFRLQILPKGVPSLQIPRHFFGELAKTSSGIEFLSSSKHIESYLKKLSEPHPIISKRAWIWALGHTGASNTGASYLLSHSGIDLLVKTAENSKVLSLRGTAAQALSLIARSPLGRTELRKYCWVSSQAYSSSIAVPDRAEKFFWVERNEKVFPFEQRCEKIERIFDGLKMSEVEKEIFRHVCLLGSLMNKTASEQFLRNLRNNAPSTFASAPLFHAVMSALAGFNFKMSTRRIIHKLFERAYRMENFKEMDEFEFI